MQLFSKKFLTPWACGGILSTEVKRGAPKGFQKDFEKNRKNLLTGSTRYAIIGTEVKGTALETANSDSQEISKKLQKPIDKPSEKCYNGSIKGP